MSDDRNNRVIIEGLASVAVTLAQMGTSGRDAREQLIAWISSLHIEAGHVPEVLRSAAASAGALPKTPDDPPHKADHRRRIRQMLGVPEPAEDRANTERGRRWLLELAEEIERSLDV